MFLYNAFLNWDIPMLTTGWHLHLKLKGLNYCIAKWLGCYDELQTTHAMLLQYSARPQVCVLEVCLYLFSSLFLTSCVSMLPYSVWGAKPEEAGRVDLVSPWIGLNMLHRSSRYFKTVAKIYLLLFLNCAMHSSCSYSYCLLDAWKLITHQQ